MHRNNAKSTEHLWAALILLTLAVGCGGERIEGSTDASEEPDTREDLHDGLDLSRDPSVDSIEDQADSPDVWELPESCTPDGPDLVGCPTSEGASHCIFSDSPVTIQGSGEPLVVQLFEDHVGLIESADDASWGYYAWTSYEDYYLDGTLRNRLSLGPERSYSAVWTETDFSVFPCIPGSLLRINEAGDFLGEYELVGCYTWVAWTGTGYAALGNTYEPTAYFVSWISGDGYEMRTSEPAHLWNEVGLEWTGCCFVQSYVDWGGIVENRGELKTYTTDWDGSDWSDTVTVDSSGLVVNGKLFRTPEGVAALWTESLEDADPLELHARFLDKFGRPCGPTIFVDEIAYDLPAGPYYYTAFTGAWADGRAVIAYLRYMEGEFVIVLRSLLSTGDLGSVSAEYPLVDEEANFMGILGVAGGSNMVSFWWNYHCVWDAPQCYDVKIYTCE